ncbi:alpha/beta hydrolase [Umezawaea endophytica]|uniref:Alpha/beta hydrolase n=1 Tax=Umezawaea endophytica TaxID=1654476 RepID=A0A9X2VSM6_9PSEU|nr:alpha/beta hydrolase [Umezawaea endophytica]MCS7481909.1 alpha/beta hydrolase [Umezawaea endophytica]
MSLVVLDLDADGNPLDPATQQPVADVQGFLARHLEVPESATDIVVFVHGWRNTKATAFHRAHRFADLVTTTYDPVRYPALGAWNSHYVVVRWPSASNPFLHGYRRIRDRAHLMSTTGRAPEALAHLLGYLNAHRERPRGTLRTKAGQYLHLVGHSFGCRFLAEAIQWAADSRPDVLGWDRSDPRYPYAADTLLMFQMAYPHDLIAHGFPRLLHDAPIGGPAVFTHSRFDRAVGLWHRLAERRTGVGHRGATEPREHISSIILRPMTQNYTAGDFTSTLVNVDANLCFRRGRFLNPAGAHADILHPESAHLILSLAELAR